MRKGITFTALLVIVLFLSFAAFADAVYNDDFSGSLKWVDFAGTMSKEVRNEKLFITNSGSNLGIIKHDDVNINSLTEFTYSVEVNQADSLNASGLFFCLPATGLAGYQFYVQKDGVFRFIRWDGTTPNYIDVGDGRTSFRNESKATLKVSKSGNTISLFCDDEYLGSVNDDNYASGEIGLVVGAGEAVEFDNVSVTNVAETGTLRSSFQDDFTDTDLKKGWRTLQGDGSYTKEDGSLTISNDIQLWTTGDYDAVACTVVVSYASGDSMGFYGVNLIGPNGGSNRTFVVNAKKYFGVYSGSGNAKTNSNIKGGDDTLVITSDHKFIVNGQILDDETFSTPGEFRGIALYAATGVTASVKSIRIGNSGTSPISHNNLKFNNSSQEYEIGGTGLIYDVRGRQVAQFEQSNYQNTLKELGTGQFFVISKNKQHMIKRAIINVK